jgi:hypothetical protein
MLLLFSKKQKPTLKSIAKQALKNCLLPHNNCATIRPNHFSVFLEGTILTRQPFFLEAQRA